MDALVKAEELSGEGRVSLESREPPVVEIAAERTRWEAVRRALGRGGYAAGIVVGMAVAVSLFFCGLGMTFVMVAGSIMAGLILVVGLWIGARAFLHQSPLRVGYRLRVDDGRFRMEATEADGTRTVLEAPVERLDLARADPITDEDLRSFCERGRHWLVTVATDTEMHSFGHGLSESEARGLVDWIEAVVESTEDIHPSNEETA